MLQTVLLTCALLVFGPAASIPGQAVADEHAEKALQFGQRGDLKNAEKELRAAVELAPNDPALLTSLGGILGMEGDLRQANIYLARAVKLNPQDPLLRRNLAANQWQLGQFREAHENLDRLLRANPQDKTAIFLLGMVSENQKDYARSIALLESVPDIAARQPEALVALASSYYHTHRSEDARQALRKLIQHPSNPKVVFTAGKVAMDAHDYAVAEAVFSSVRSTYSNPAAVDFEIALAQYHDHRLAESEKTLTKAIEANRRTSDTYVLLCKVLADSGATTRALKMASQGSQIFPDSYDLISAKGAMELKAQYFADAVASYEKAARLNPRSSNVKRDLALAEWRAGMRERSAAAFEQAIREFPADAETYQTYAVLLLEEGSPQTRPRAVELLQQALARNDSSVEARYQLGNIALENGKPALALPYLERAITLDPRDSRLHYTLSRAYRRLGRSSDADREVGIYQKLKAAEAPAANNDSTTGTPR